MFHRHEIFDEVCIQKGIHNTPSRQLLPSEIYIENVNVFFFSFAMHIYRLPGVC